MAEKEEEKVPTRKTSGKVFDVRRPGKAPAPPTSKPVIIGHKPEAQEAQAAVSGIGEARPLMTKRKIQITPASGSDVAPASEVAPAEEVPASQSVAPEKDSQAAAGPPDLPTSDILTMKTGPKLRIEPPQAPETKTASAPTVMDVTKPTAQPSPAESTTEPELKPEEQPAETSSVPEEPAATPGQGQGAELQEEPAPEPHIEPLFNEAGVVVSTHNHHHRHHAWHVLGLLLLMVLLAAVGLNIALDLDLLNLEGIPHTDFL